MHCHQCGAKTYGKYCSKCGTKLITVDSNLEPLPQDWANEIRYEVVLSIPEVRDLVARHASQAKKRMSGENFLKLCDKAFVPMTGVSLAKIGAIAQPIYATLGLKTGKIRKEFFTEPVGKVLIATICSLARHGQSLNKVEQGEDGCLLKAVIPSDIWSFRGDFIITIQHQEQGSSIEAATVIKGQLYDWGKSKRILTKLFDDIKSLPV